MLPGVRDQFETRLWDDGYWIRNPYREASQRRIVAFRLPERIAKLATTSAPRSFVVAREKVTTPYGFSFSSVGWHPYVDALQQVGTGTAHYRASALARFHRVFAPRLLDDALVIAPADEGPLGNGLTHSWPLIRDLWMHVGTAAADAIAETATRSPMHQRCPHVGPYDTQAGEMTWNRLLRVHENMRAYGYDPDRFDRTSSTGFDGFGADGYFLWDGNDYRFVLLHGHHRLGAATHLGIAQVRVAVRRRHLPIVERSNLDSGDAAPWLFAAQRRTVFDLLFNHNGRSKAEAWGLAR